MFFFVGGFSNGISWAATSARGGTFSDWYGGRLQRLINPVMPPSFRALVENIIAEGGEGDVHGPFERWRGAIGALVAATPAHV